MNISVHFVLFVLAVRFARRLTLKTLCDLSQISKVIERFRDRLFIKGIQMLLVRHSNILDKAVLQELLHHTALHDVTDQEQGGILLEVAFRLEVIQEFLESPLLSLAQPVHFIHQNGSTIGCRRMN
uniref:Uncharacterized protein n=1 Tax=viral metagenome TaxID=1070528 RepID=A0A6C0DGN4_9ZZZZ